MQVNTAIFGSLDIAAENILEMQHGPLGFDEYRQYALLEREDQGVVFRWLQATDNESICFVVFDPYEVITGYSPELERRDLKELGCSRPEDLRYYAIAVVPEDYTKATINLKSPIAVNPVTNVAKQVILQNVDYPIRFPLAGDNTH